MYGYQESGIFPLCSLTQWLPESQESHPVQTSDLNLYISRYTLLTVYSVTYTKRLQPYALRRLCMKSSVVTEAIDQEPTMAVCNMDLYNWHEHRFYCVNVTLLC